MAEQKQPGWKDVPMAGLILEAGNAIKYKTGGWRTFKPIHNMDKCIHCLQCNVFCPDSAIIVENDKFVKFDYEHCKGCGICASVCPSKVQAIIMEKEEIE